MSVLERRVVVRKGLRLLVTKNCSGILEAVQNEEDEVIKVKYRLLMHAVERLNDINDKILDLVELSDIEKEMQEQEIYNEKVYVAKEAVDTFNKAKLCAKSNTADTVSQVRLSKLIIEPFNGTILEFQSFIDQFNASVNRNSNLNDVEKLNYLKSLLTGAASETIAGLSMTDVNYKIAIDIITKRYGNKNLQIQAHVGQLLSIKTVSSIDNPAQLRTLLDQVVINICSLEALGVAGDTYSAILLPILVSKLPQNIRIVWSKREGLDADVHDLLNFLSKEVKSLEIASNNIGLEIERPVVNHNISVAAALPCSSRNESAAINDNLNSTQDQCYGAPLCIYCEGDHSSGACQKVTNIAKRRAIIRRTWRCYACLKKGHSTNNCQSKSRCVKCKGFHHTSICENVATAKQNKPKKQDNNQTSVMLQHN